MRLSRIINKNNLKLRPDDINYFIFQAQPPSANNSRPSSAASGSNGGGSSSSSKVKVPQNFGYVKRQNGVQQAGVQTNGGSQNGKTKVK